MNDADRAKFLEEQRKRIFDEKSVRFANRVDLSLTLQEDAHDFAIGRGSNPGQSSVQIFDSHNVNVASNGSSQKVGSQSHLSTETSNATRHSKKVPWPVLVLLIGVVSASATAICWHFNDWQVRVPVAVGGIVVVFLLPRDPVLFFRRQLGICIVAIVVKKAIPHFKLNTNVVGVGDFSDAFAFLNLFVSFSTVETGVDWCLFAALLVLGFLEYKRMQLSEIIV